MTRETGRWRWSDVYPGTHVVTLVLPHDEARNLLDQARAQGRMIARDTVLGMPTLAASSGAQPAETHGQSGQQQFFSVVRVLDTKQDRPVPPVAEMTDHPVEQPADEQAVELAQPQQAEGGSNVVILPCVRRERIDPPKPAMPARTKRIVVPSARPSVETALTVRPRRSVFDELPPVPAAPEPQPRTKFNPATGRMMRAGEVTAAERQMVAEAIAAGFPVTRCPPGKYSADVVEAPLRVKTRRQRLAERREGRANPGIDAGSDGAGTDGVQP
jgi:hypothetical protein